MTSSNLLMFSFEEIYQVKIPLIIKHKMTMVMWTQKGLSLNKAGLWQKYSVSFSFQNRHLLSVPILTTNPKTFSVLTRKKPLHTKLSSVTSFAEGKVVNFSFPSKSFKLSFGDSYFKTPSICLTNSQGVIFFPERL